jgi:D-xylulose reductase
MEPLSVAVNAVCKVAELRAVDNVAVFGAGPVGLLYGTNDMSLTHELIYRTMAVCKAMGARRIIAIDVSEGRLAFAKKYAATNIHLSSPMNEGEDRPAYSKRHVRLYQRVKADIVRRNSSRRNSA